MSTFEVTRQRTDPESAIDAKVRDRLKSALQEQLANELMTLGTGGDLLTIHGRTGVSNFSADVLRGRKD